MIFQPQHKIEYGFKDMNGNTWCDQWVDSYNNYTSAINNTANREIVTDSLTDQERNFFLDQRHKFYVHVSAMLVN